MGRRRGPEPDVIAAIVTSVIILLALGGLAAFIVSQNAWEVL